MRRSTILWSVLCIAVVIGLFVVKHRVQDLEDRLQALNAEILSDRDATQVLEAEWSYLNQPARLEALSRKLLGMEPPSAGQTLTLDEFRLQAAPDEETGHRHRRYLIEEKIGSETRGRSGVRDRRENQVGQAGHQ